MQKLSAAIALLHILLFFNACQNRPLAIIHKIKADCEYYSMKSAQCLDKEQMLTQIEPYKVIFIGDHHPQDSLHSKIASLITALSAKGITVHLANEWFYPEDAEVLKQFSDNTIDEETFLKQIQWGKRLRYYKYDSFKPMYEAVKRGGGKLYGINLSKQARTKISDQNLSAMDHNERVFNKGLDLDVTPHRNLIMPFFSHCHAPKSDESLQECRERMYRVQVAWDTKMALESYKLAQKLKRNEKLIIFAGAMHIENELGIPLRFSRLSPMPTLSIIPLNAQTKETINGLGDYLLFYQEKREGLK
jgi:uncharacterized iron-regulated protein